MVGGGVDIHVDVPDALVDVPGDANVVSVDAHHGYDGCVDPQNFRFLFQWITEI